MEVTDAIIAYRRLISDDAFDIVVKSVVSLKFAGLEPECESNRRKMLKVTVRIICLIKFACITEILKG
ncbi:hypothetical protein HK096_010415 [Nowakowskiella sp. JEL0078]|nr:hypothetical protein HK096_010415 [Nowakowskiella sp. JEL0078]